MTDFDPSNLYLLLYVVQSYDDGFGLCPGLESHGNVVLRQAHHV